ncbi:MAG: chromosomal replication initiator protein DnaA [Aestuariivita sp.]|nr:chromosomal replication initiator protein DnaA [Aestuariivita sp.]MCY4201187.1 chromosomal replication initiator protein DnaA [Aestuariivita sp.]
MKQEEWNQPKEELQKSLGQSNFASWIEPLVFSSLAEGIASFKVPTAFMGSYVNQNFGDRIIGAFAKSGQPVSRLKFTVSDSEEALASSSTATLKAEKTDAHDESTYLEALLQTAPLDYRFTFDQFVVGKPNELAHAAARRVAEADSLAFNPLFLYGGVGLGKTHLMHAIAWELSTCKPHLQVLYLSAEQFMYRFVQSLRERRMMDFKHIFRSVDVLMVDDVQFIAGKDSTQEEFFHTFNALIDQKKQIVISADRAPGEIKKLENRIKSRLQCGLVVDIHPTDYELRLGVLQSKVENYRERNQFNIDIADGVLEFLALRMSTNVRVLEGALNRLFAFSDLVGRPIDMDLTKDCLSDSLRAAERKITVEEIQRQVADYYHIRLSDMIGPKRLRTYARPRQVAMFLSKNLTARSLPEIGRRFGGRDHTTVMHGVRRIEELASTDGQVAEDIEMIRRALED